MRTYGPERAPRVRRRLALLLSLLACGLVSAPAGAIAASPSDFDPAFGDGGIAQLDTGPDGPFDVTVADDGSLVAVGADYSQTPVALWIQHVLPDGEPDDAFGEGGVRVLPELQAFLTLVVAAAPDGTFYVVGSTDSDGTLAIAHLDADGSVDPAFGIQRAPIAMARATYAYPACVQVDAAGRLVIAGTAIQAMGGADSRPWIARFDPATGALDPTFHDGTPWMLYDSDPNDLQASINDLALLRDGSIAAVGQMPLRVGGAPLLVRLHSDGTPDPEVGGTGAMLLPQHGWLDGAPAIEPVGSGFVVASTFEPTSTGEPSPTGTVVAGFYDASSAIEREWLVPTAPQYVDGLSIDPSGRAVIAGNLTLGSNDPGVDTDEMVMRVSRDSGLDQTFAPGGIQRVTLPGRPWLYDLTARRGAIIGVGVRSDPDGFSGPSQLIAYHLLGDAAAATPTPSPTPAPTLAPSPAPTEQLLAAATATAPSIRSAIVSPADGAKLARGKRLTIRGTASGIGGTVHQVAVAIRRVHVRGCSWVRTIYGGFTNSRRQAGACAATHWLYAEGTDTWRLTIADRLPKGLYEIRTSAVLSTKLREAPRSSYVRLR